jgi:hypothetical protein
MLTGDQPSVPPPSIAPTPPGRAAHPVADPTRPAGLPHKIPPQRRAPSGPTVSDAAAPIFPEHLFDRPSSVFVYGPSRPLVNLTLFAFAEATTPLFQWVDIGVPGEDRTVFDPVRLGWIPEDRLWPVDRPDGLRPDDLSANVALFSLIRSDEPPANLVRLTEFLRLPETSQRILATRPLDGRPGALAVTNAHRVMAIFPANRIPPILSVHRDAGFSVLVGYAETPGPGRNLFDFVFRLDCEHIGDWKKGHLVCEKGITSGPLRDARPVLLEAIPMIADVLSRAMSSQ